VALQKVNDALAALGGHQGRSAGLGGAGGVHEGCKFSDGGIMAMMPETRIRVIDNDLLWLILI
jgi:hypothetical protein